MNEKLNDQIHQCILHDQQRLIKQVKKLRNLSPAEVKKLERQIFEVLVNKQTRIKACPKVSIHGDLPIGFKQEEIRTSIHENQVVVVCGETGSSKTTQLPKICLDMGRGISLDVGRISCIAIRTGFKNVHASI